MQPHEGPRRNDRADARERRRQRVMTMWLSGAIAALAAVMIVTLVWR